MKSSLGGRFCSDKITRSEAERDASEAHNDENSPLLCLLPSELRNRILEHVLPEDACICLSSRKNGSNELRSVCG